MADSFVFFRLMYDTWMKLQDPMMRLQYFEAVFQYGLDGTLPDDPVMQALINGAVFSIDRSREISAINSENGKKHTWNQYTRWDKKRKPTQEAQKSAVERIGTNWSELERNGTEVRSIEVRRVEDKKLEENKNKKQKYMDFVFLTETEHTSLVNRFWLTKTNYWIDRLNSYIGQIGVASASKKYKSHYFTILNRDRREWWKGSSDLAKEEALAKHREHLREQYLSSIESSDVWSEKKAEAFDRRWEVLGA